MLMKTKMKKTAVVIGVVAVIIIALAIVLLQQSIAGEERRAPDGVDIMPNLKFKQCLSEIKKINPEMNEQQAQDNCYTVQAINENDVSICDKVSTSARTNCLKMFD